MENINNGRNIKYKMLTIDTNGLNSPKLRLLDGGKREEKIQRYVVFLKRHTYQQTKTENKKNE